MENQNIVRDIARRTDGDIYIGVVGPVRTGKSTFIKKFMEDLVIPNIQGEARRERAVDELPQSAAGRTIMTTEPKFIPEEAVEVSLEDGTSFRTRLIDCVGYIVPSSIGYVENESPRMVMTPWFPEEIPFNMAAEIGTQKVINEHSTIGLVVTTDGSISDIPREEYQEAEERVIRELTEIRKPFVVLLNCADPTAASAQQLRQEMEERYGVPVLALSCLAMTREEVVRVLGAVLYQFPVREIAVQLPRWIFSLPAEHWLRKSLFSSITEAASGVERLQDTADLAQRLSDAEYVAEAVVREILPGEGAARMRLGLDEGLFYKVLGETTGLSIENEEELMTSITELAAAKREYDKVKDALDQVNATGYGIVMPSIDELTLDEPEIVKQGGRYGVRLRASAPSIHLMRADITTEVAPIVGSERQSEDLVMYLLKEFEDSPEKIWESNIFGKSLHELVNEGLHNKLSRMPADARIKLQETIERIINEGCSGLICIIL